MPGHILMFAYDFSFIVLLDNSATFYVTVKEATTYGTEPFRLPLLVSGTIYPMQLIISASSMRVFRSRLKTHLITISYPRLRFDSLCAL